MTQSLIQTSRHKKPIYRIYLKPEAGISVLADTEVVFGRAGNNYDDFNSNDGIPGKRWIFHGFYDHRVYEFAKKSDAIMFLTKNAEYAVLKKDARLRD